MMVLQLVLNSSFIYFTNRTFTMAESNNSTPQSINTQVTVSSPEADELAYQAPCTLFRNIDDAISPPAPADMAVLLSVVNHEDRHLLQDEEGALDDDQLTVGTFSTANNYTIKHIGDDPRNSAKAKAKSAFMHCNYFLRQYMPTKTKKKPKEAFIPLQELVLSQNPAEGNIHEKSAQWFSEMMGCFFYYLANEAYARCKPAFGRIAYNSATGYASSVKSYLTNKFRNIPIEIPAFKQSIWASYRAKLLNAYHEEGTKSGKSLTNPHEASTARDRQAIAVGCLWQNSSVFAEFWHMNNSMTHCTGRGSEVALLRLENLTSHTVNEYNHQYDILQVLLKRHKNHKEQLLPIYPHRDNFMEDWYFSLIYSYIMQDHNSDYLCPTFASKAGTLLDDKFDSQVSQYWKKMFVELFPLAVAWERSLNPNLSSHHGKKGSTQKMAETHAVSGLAQIFRAGWEVRGFHSLFDYVVGSLVMAHQAGKAVAGWSCKQGDNIVGGMPPVTSDVTSNVEQFRTFVGYIFARDSEYQVSCEIREILVATLLRYYDDVLCNTHDFSIRDSTRE